jgi:hypothetical protein
MLMGGIGKNINFFSFISLNGSMMSRLLKEALLNVKIILILPSVKVAINKFSKKPPNPFFFIN